MAKKHGLEIEMLVQTLRYIFEIGEERDGQIVIYTNCYLGDNDFPILFPDEEK